MDAELDVSPSAAITIAWQVQGGPVWSLCPVAGLQASGPRGSLAVTVTLDPSSGTVSGESRCPYMHLAAGPDGCHTALANPECAAAAVISGLDKHGTPTTLAETSTHLSRDAAKRSKLHLKLAAVPLHSSAHGQSRRISAFADVECESHD